MIGATCKAGARVAARMRSQRPQRQAAAVCGLQAPPTTAAHATVAQAGACAGSGAAVAAARSVRGASSAPSALSHGAQMGGLQPTAGRGHTSGVAQPRRSQLRGCATVVRAAAVEAPPPLAEMSDNPLLSVRG
eukprot:353600-Chlamydomonas_euryale.AAC.10